MKSHSVVVVIDMMTSQQHYHDFITFPKYIFLMFNFFI